MTAHPNDTDALLDRLRRNAQAPMDRFDRLHGMGGLPEYGEDERPFPDEVLKLLDLLAAAEHRATRAEAQSAIRGRAVAIYQARAREAEAENERLRVKLRRRSDTLTRLLEDARTTETERDAQTAQCHYWKERHEASEQRLAEAEEAIEYARAEMAACDVHNGAIE